MPTLTFVLDAGDDNKHTISTHHWLCNRAYLEGIGSFFKHATIWGGGTWAPLAHAEGNLCIISERFKCIWRRFHQIHIFSHPHSLSSPKYSANIVKGHNIPISDAIMVKTDNRKYTIMVVIYKYLFSIKSNLLTFYRIQVCIWYVHNRWLSCQDCSLYFQNTLDILSWFAFDFFHVSNSKELFNHHSNGLLQLSKWTIIRF